MNHDSSAPARSHMGLKVFLVSAFLLVGEVAFAAAAHASGFLNG